MHSIKDVLKSFNPMEDKYVSREFQAYGVHLSEKLGDEKHKPLYIKMARDIPRPMLERALRFVIDSHAGNKAGLFMWKLKEINAFANMPSPPSRKKKKRETTRRKKEVSSQPKPKRSSKKAQTESLFGN